MKVKMLEAREAALDGVHFMELEKSGVYDVPEFLGESYLERGIAEKADADALPDEAQPVPDPGAGAAIEDAAGEEPAVEQASSGAAAEASPAGPSLEELMKLSRAELDKQAQEAAVEGAEELPNKQAVAEAILAAGG